MSRPPLGTAVELGRLSLGWYSLLIVLGIAVGVWLAMREEKRLGLPRDTILNFSLLAIPLGIVGARLYYVLFSWNYYAGNWLEIFRTWNGGLAIYGGILGGVFAAWIIARRGKMNIWTLLDACMPSLALAQSIGRWGNYANMEAYGARIYDSAAQFFPLAVEIPIVGANGAVYWYWHMATFFYESLWCFVLFLALMRFRRRMTRPGDAALWYTLLYCAGRTVIEGLREDSLMLVVAAAQVRVSQILSALACLGVVLFLFLRLRKARRLRTFDWLALSMAALGIACTFVSEFERNAYQMLFVPAQVLLAALMACDIAFFVHCVTKAGRLRAPTAWALVCALLCACLLAAGIGRLGNANTGFVALRQAVSMGHVILCGAWLYLRCGPPRRSMAPSQNTRQEESAHAATA